MIFSSVIHVPRGAETFKKSVIGLIFVAEKPLDVSAQSGTRQIFAENFKRVSTGRSGQEWSPLPDLNRGPADFSGCIGFTENTLQSAALASLS